MDVWDPGAYMRFGDERTRPSVDLVSRIALESPKSVIDLGCGPGNSTAVLKSRWPAASVVGLDSSADMIDAARDRDPLGEWVVSDIATWQPETRFDVVFSNAALQWIPDHGQLVNALFSRVSDSGALAFQIPSADYALVRTLIHEIALEGPWAARMQAPLTALTMESPGFYYDRLADTATSIDVWETEYIHVMADATAIVDWIGATGLRPFLDALESEGERNAFRDRLLERVTSAYPPHAEGRRLFPFKRTFVIAYA